MYECGLPMADEPDEVTINFVNRMGQIDRPHLQAWAEVGSRWNERLMTGDSFDADGFLVVQPSVYRFMFDIAGGIAVHSVMYEYLYAYVRWD
jgi:hypothetical protein